MAQSLSVPKYITIAITFKVEWVGQSSKGPGYVIHWGGTRYYTQTHTHSHRTVYPTVLNHFLNQLSSEMAETPKSLINDPQPCACGRRHTHTRCSSSARTAIQGWPQSLPSVGVWHSSCRLHCLPKVLVVHWFVSDERIQFPLATMKQRDPFYFCHFGALFSFFILKSTL